jgi:hypothetical protein
MKSRRRVGLMANLQIKGVDDDLYAGLKDLAASENLTERRKFRIRLLPVIRDNQ